MVWGLKDPSGYGDYSPGGHYVGWEQRLTEYFDTQMPLDEMSQFLPYGSGEYTLHVSQKFTREQGRVFGEGIPIGPIAEHEWPTWFETRQRYTNLGSLLETNSRMLAVDEQLKNIIEGLEPEVHQFRPLTITMPKGETYPKRYYTMVIGQFLDSFDPEKSNDGTWTKSKNHDSYTIYIPMKKYYEGLALSKSGFEGAHLWRERRLRNPEIFFF